MNKKIIIFVGTFFLIMGLAQAQKKELRGKITNDGEVEGIHIRNSSSGYNTISDENGQFSILTKELDTLLFISVKYAPEIILVTDKIWDAGTITVQLRETVNELDEVVIAPNLSGNIRADLAKIQTDKPVDFEDLGLPGFKGIPQERIVPIFEAFSPTSLKLELMYKYISGYYRKLKIRRKWDVENSFVANIFNYYTEEFFVDTYKIPHTKIHDFLLFCAEATQIESEFKKERYGSVFLIFEEKAKEYLSRIPEE
ncbi:peptidase associated/transthyretin-like domain-containing protein [Aequorivita echinoideorum]|uniref:CarboxypepD_reg-like domain-containing protein n=1 Tax=Aequorivita echinoideorum TaxID=1549647 RepID=A0ABS5S7C6_9FLAO|nr:hypothetical protein [Aequorivita echinoideorum]MBT0609113.1 hypothetical protein [Aequorivita echinoideorum]